MRSRRGSLASLLAIVLAAAQPVAGQPPSPGSSATRFFGLEATGNRFVYVFDHSASMGEPAGRPLVAAKRELLASIDGLAESRQFHVIAYNDRLSVFAPGGQRGRPTFADDSGRREVRRFIESVTADGGTRHCEAVAAALRLAPDVIFLLTDADEPDDLTDDELRRLARSLGRARIMLVQFGGASGRRSPRLARLAAESGGAVTVVDPEPE
ncbi:MAG: VWA domain-containing protein [Pirellulales bacterium]